MKEFTLGIMFALAGIFLAVERQPAEVSPYADGWVIRNDFIETGEDAIDFQNSYPYYEIDTTVVDTIVMEYLPSDSGYNYVVRNRDTIKGIIMTFYLYADSSGGE